MDTLCFMLFLNTIGFLFIQVAPIRMSGALICC